MSGLRWTRKTTEKIAEQLLGLGIAVSATTEARLLDQMIGLFKNYCSSVFDKYANIWRRCPFNWRIDDIERVAVRSRSSKSANSARMSRPC
jgi:hypothetical protein